MAPIVRLDEEAEEELQAAAAWYERERAGFGMALLDAVVDGLARLQETPHAFGLAPGVSSDLAVRRVLIQRFPYALVFIELEGEIRVLAIAHSRRRPGYWLERITR